MNSFTAGLIGMLFSPGGWFTLFVFFYLFRKLVKHAYKKYKFRRSLIQHFHKDVLKYGPNWEPMIKGHLPLFHKTMIKKYGKNWKEVIAQKTGRSMEVKSPPKEETVPEPMVHRPPVPKAWEGNNGVDIDNALDILGEKE